MALLKEIKLINGIATYHRIIVTNIYWQEQAASLMIESLDYADGETIGITDIFFDKTNFPFISGKDILPTAYEAVKKLPEWASADDI